MNRVTLPLQSWRSNDSSHISHRYGNQLRAVILAHKCRRLFPDFPLQFLELAACLPPMLPVRCSWSPSEKHRFFCPPPLNFLIILKSAALMDLYVRRRVYIRGTSKPGEETAPGGGGGGCFSPSGVFNSIGKMLTVYFSFRFLFIWNKDVVYLMCYFQKKAGLHEEKRASAGKSPRE